MEELTHNPIFNCRERITNFLLSIFNKVIAWLSEMKINNIQKYAHKTRRINVSSPIPAVINLFAFTMFIVVTSEFVVMGLLPDMAFTFSISLANAGWFVTWFALSASLLGPVVTLLASRFNTHTFIISSVLIFSVANFAIALVQYSYFVVILRILQGALLPAIISILVIESLYLVERNRQAWAVSHVNLGIAFAVVLGIPGGAMIASKMGWKASFMTLALLGVVATLLLYRGLPRISREVNEQLIKASDLSLLWLPHFLYQLTLSAILFTGMFTGYTYIAVLLTEITNINKAMLAWLLMGFGISGVLGNWLAGLITHSYPITATAGVALSLAFAMGMVTLVGDNPITMMLVIVLWGGAHMGAFVINQIRVMQAGNNAQSFALALNISACNIGIALGAILGGRVVDNYGVEFVGYAGSAIVLVAFFMACGVMLFRQKNIYQ